MIFFPAGIHGVSAAKLQRGFPGPTKSIQSVWISITDTQQPILMHILKIFQRIRCLLLLKYNCETRDEFSFNMHISTMQVPKLDTALVEQSK